MLVISHGAAEAIKQIVISSQVPEAGGIRLSAESTGDQNIRLDLSLAESPLAGDTVVEKEGAQVFLDQDVAPLLDDKVLDVAVENDRLSFAIVEARQDWSQNGRPESFDPKSIE